MPPRPKEEKNGSSAGARPPRCRTGIEGLDKILNGGIPLGNNVLLTGACGTGKTTLGAGFLNFGTQNGEPGLMLAITEHSQKVLENMKGFEFFDTRMVDEKKLQVLDAQPIFEGRGLDKIEYAQNDVPFLINTILDTVKQAGAKRVVIDSITGILLHLRARELMRDFISKLCRKLSEAGCTTLLVSEIAPDEKRYSSFGVEEAVADGIIVLGNVEQRGYLLRTLHVVKMRGTSHSRSRYVIDLTPYGIIIVPLLRSGATGPA